YEVQYALSVALRGEAAVAVPSAQLFELIVQIPHSFCSSLFSVDCPGVRFFVVAGMTLARSVFLSVSNASALREPHGTRDTTPVLCRVLLSAAAARGIGADGASCGKTDHRVSYCPKARGAPVGTVARGPAGSERVQTALRGL